jgi:uncharacterized membrane protein YgcG
MRRETGRAMREAVAARLRVAGTAVAAVGLAALGGISVPGSADAAAGGFNQITGAGQTDSALTVDWTKGLLGSDNKPLTPAQESAAGDRAPNEDRSAASPAGTLSFMYDNPNRSKDQARPATWFKGLQVTVSQTKDIRAQGITVTWTGGGPGTTLTGANAGADFLQMMECYGDASTGPNPEDCEYGSPFMLGPPSQAVNNPVIGQRTGPICAPGSTPSTTAPPLAFDGRNAIWGCDPYEPGTATPSHYAPPCDSAGAGGPDCDNANFSVPFVPADGSDPEYGRDLNQSFNSAETNEVQQATSDSNGTGKVQFEALTSTESSGLGCGALEDNGQVRNCWLVIVPRGEYEPNGYAINPLAAGSFNGYLKTSPLSAGNWAMRIQVHLNYAPNGAFCQIGTPLTHVAGTQLLQRAMQSWIIALAQKDNCAQMYSFAVNSERELTTAMTDNTGVGVGFTTIPVGTEGLEDPGGTAIKVPKMVYAPVAVEALGFGFNINEGSTGFAGTSMKVTPTLLAKALTQVYRTDLPDYLPSSGLPGPAWSQANPDNITSDNEWQKLNPPGIVSRFTASSSTLAPLVVGDRNALIQQVWQWVRSDPAASGWLSGTGPISGSVTLDPDYKKLKLGNAKPVTNFFPRAYTGELSLTVAPGQVETKNTGDLLPVVSTFDKSASDVLVGNNPTLGGWDPTLISPTGTTGWWASVPPQPVGQRFIWGLADTSSMAAYGLIPATLCGGDGKDGTGAGCVTLSEASINSALKTAKADSSGLLHIDPAKAQAAGGWPLVDVVYAAVETGQAKALLSRDAELLSFAVGAGQTVGTAAGDLPPGYLPLPASLVKQAQSVITQLRKLASPVPTPTPTGTQSSSASGSTSGNGGAGTSGSGTGGGSTGGTTSHATTQPGTSSSSAAPAPSATRSLNIEPPSAQLASGTTPDQPVGAAGRWAIIAVVIAGLACAAAGIVLRSARLPWQSGRTGGAGS